MANRKEYDLLLSIKAAVGSGFNSTFGAATTSLRTMQNELQGIQKIQKDVSAYTKSEAALKSLIEKKQQLTVAVGDNTAAIQKVNAQIEKEEQNLSNLGDKLKKAGVDTEKLAEESKRLGNEYEKLQKKQEELANLEKWQRETSAALKEAQKDFIKTTAVVAGLGVAFYKGFIEPAAEFESEMSNIKAITGATQDELQQMADGIRDISRTTGTDLSEITQNAKMLAEAGGDVNLMMEQLRHGTNLANATQSDMATTYDFVVSQMRTFNIEAEDTRLVTDSFALVTSMANLELSQLGYAFVNTGGSAAQAGMEINDVNAIMVAFSEAGLKGGSAGTSLNAVLRNLSTPTEKAQAALNELEIAIYEECGASRDMLEIIADVQDTLADMSDEHRNMYQQIIFDTVAQKGWNIIVDEGVDSIKEIRDELNSSVYAYDGAGQAAGMAATQIDNFKGDIALAKSELKYLSVTVGSMFLPDMRNIAQTIADVIRTTGDWIEENPELTRQIIEIARNIAILTVGVKGAKVVFLLLKKEMIAFRVLAKGAAPEAKTFAAVLKTLGPAGAVGVAALAALAIAIELNKKRMRELQQEYAYPLLFDNGGMKLSEFTDNLIANTRFTYENARAVNESRKIMEENRLEIQNASRDIDFYGYNLRTHGILTPSEAEAMIEPFNSLVEALENDFTVRYDVVFTAFKNAATSVAESLGADIAEISSLLDGFKNKYTNELTASQTVVNAHLERVSSGEEVTKADWDTFSEEMKFIRDMEAAASEAAREYARIKDNFASINFGDNPEQALEEIKRLREYVTSYQDELTTAQINLNEDISVLTEQAGIMLASGRMNKSEYEDYIAAFEAARYIIYQSYVDDFNALNAEVAALAKKAKNQADLAGAALIRNMSDAEMVWATTRAALNSWVEDQDLEKSFERVVYGKVYDVIEDLNKVLRKTNLQPLVIDAELSPRAAELLSGAKDPRASHYTVVNPFENGYSNFQSFKDLMAQNAYAVGTDSAARGFALVGERGPELVDFAGGERVYTANDTRRILTAPSVNTTTGGNISVHIDFAPIIRIDGDSPGDLDEKLKILSRQVAEQISETLREERLNERRTVYA